MQLIENQQDFDTICKQLTSEKILFIDTEFDRTRTYYPILSLVQIATEKQQFIVDALAKIDLLPLKPILADNKIIKVFHAATQDLEIFFHLFHELPKNVFDTQIAAGIAGMREVMGYDKLCKALLDIEIDKTLQKANWLQRPLTPELIEYALGDTKYLIPIYEKLNLAIKKQNFSDKLKISISKLLDVNNYKPNPGKILSRMRLPDESENFTDKLQMIIAFREECAQKLNIPRSFCANDKNLIRVCQKLPINNQELEQTGISHKPIARREFRNKLFELCEGLKSSIN